MRHIVELTNGNTVTTERTCESFYSPTDGHYVYAMRFVFNGSENCIAGPRNINIFPDRFALFNAGTSYIAKIDHPVPVSSLSIALAAPFVRDFFNTFEPANETRLHEDGCQKNSLFMEGLYPLSATMSASLASLKRYVVKGSYDEMLVNDYLHRCLYECYRIHSVEVSDKLSNLNSASPATRKEILRRLLLAREFIYSNFMEKITVMDISSYCCLSISHLLKKFREVYGTSPHQYLTHIRLERAKSMLLGTNAPICKVVQSVGFSDESAFIRLFSIREGATPLRFRKLSQNTSTTASNSEQ